MNNFPHIYQSFKYENCVGGLKDGTGKSRDMWRNRELKLGFAGVAKLTCKHVSLACAIHVNTAKLPLLKQREKEALFVRINISMNDEKSLLRSSGRLFYSNSYFIID